MRNVAIGGVSALVAGVLSFAINAEPASAATFTTTTSSWTASLNCGGWNYFAIPPDATNITFRLVGGGGAAGDNYKYINTASGGSGGQGGVVTGALEAASVAGKRISARIGCGGTDQSGSTRADGYVQGGYSPNTSSGGGGGASALCLGTASTACNTVLAIAGGGGGGGRGQANLLGTTYNGGSGGNAGLGTASNRNGGVYVPGSAGTQGGNSGGGGGGGSAVNAPSDTTSVPPLSPSFGLGGVASSHDWPGGGGGGGLIGGGAGGSGQNGSGAYRAGGGGGAGGSWFKSSIVTGGGFASAGTTNTNCAANSYATTVTGSSAGHGGAPGGVGCAGYIQITYSINSSGTAYTTQPSSTAIAGTAFGTQPVVRATNPASPTSGGIGGEPIRLTYSGTSSGTLQCSANPVTTNSTGYASFSGCYLPSAGTYTIIATNQTTNAVANSITVTVTSNNDWSGHTVTISGCGTNSSYALPVTATSMTGVNLRGGGGGGGAGGANSARGGNGAAGAQVTAGSVVGLNPAVTPNVNYNVGCGGGGGTSIHPSSGTTVLGGAGGNGWGKGGNGGTISSGGNRTTSGGGGGGASVICLGTSSSNCSAGTPLAVAAGGGGGGGTSYDNSSFHAGGAFGSPSQASAGWYGSGSLIGTSYGGHGGQRGNDSAGGGGGGSAGAAGQSGGASSAGGSAGGANSPGGGGGGYNAAAVGSAGSGQNGGEGGAGKSDSRRSSGGGGGGGYYGGGGGGGDYGSGSPGSGGGGSGSSWISSSALGGVGFSRNGGGTAGAGGASDAGGASGSAGGLTFSLAGTAIRLTTPANQSSTVGATGLSLAIPTVFSTVDGKISCCVYTATGLPSTMSINSSTGTISGTAPTVAQTVSITVTARTTANSFLAAGAQFSTSVTFQWVFNPAAPNKVVLTQSPANPTQVDTDFGVEGEIRDVYGNVVTSSTAVVTVAIKPGTGTSGANLVGAVTVNAVEGVASFPELAIDRTGFNYRLVMSSGTLIAAETGAFDVVVFASQGGILQLGADPDDPVLPAEPGLPPDFEGTAGSGVAEVLYYLCSGYQNSTACTSSNGTLIGQSAIGPDYHVDWTVASTPGQFRVVAVMVDKVGNRKNATASTPLRII